MRRRRERGFSLLEMMAVVTILLILGAMASPQLLRAIRSYRRESALRQVGDLIKRARYEAMRRNQRIATVYAGPAGNLGPALGIDFNMNSTLDAGEPRALLPPDMWLFPGTIQNWWVSSPDYTNCLLTSNLNFAPDGTLVEQVGGNWQISSRIPAVYMFSFDGNDIYTVTVTPAGNVKMWTFHWRKPPWGYQQIHTGETGQ